MSRKDDLLTAVNAAIATRLAADPSQVPHAPNSYSVDWVGSVALGVVRIKAIRDLGAGVVVSLSTFVDEAQLPYLNAIAARIVPIGYDPNAFIPYNGPYEFYNNILKLPIV